jgi:2-polyprenyl-6-methoxyphenol hydroxylase-like FAD-dependent oxidoreductase
MTTHTEVLIVGAGPTGLALACLLSKAGIRVRVVDKQSGRSRTSKAIGLQYRVSEILACMGVVDRFIAQGSSPTTVNIYHQDERLVALRFQGAGRSAGQGAFVPLPIMIPQSETERILGERLQKWGFGVEWNTEFLDCTQEAKHVTARLRNVMGQEVEVQCAWLVSCEGAHSVMRKLAGMTFEGTTYPLDFLMADVHLDGDLDHTENHVWMHPEGSFAALPFPEAGRWRLFVEVSHAGDALPQAPGLPFIENLMARRIGSHRFALSDATWISPFSINCRMVDRYREGRLFVAGDAAHIHSPTGGQGIATGIQDAANLAWKLVRVLRYGAPEALLESYDTERRAQAREVLKATNRTTSIFFAPTAWLKLLRDHVALPILRSEWAQAKMFAKLSQLHVHYRDSALSRQEDYRWWPPKRIRAGDRAPDLLFTQSWSGNAITLFQLLQGMRPIVLFRVGDGAESSARAADLIARCRARGIDAYEVHRSDVPTGATSRHCLIDVHGELTRLYGFGPNFLCLVRPDDHLGLVQCPVDERRLIAYLTLIGTVI